MMGNLNPPFKVGEQIESRSFDEGYRGAWFRCTIKGIKKIKGFLHYLMKYCDFPDEEVTPEKIYQKPPFDSRSKKQLMMRPAFPPIHQESQMPDPNTISDVVVIVDDVWKVGDLVDWFTTGCYWSGTITEILENKMVQVDLLPPPAGEGSSYEVSTKELRPSLDWSEELGWVVPHPMDKENHRCCARLIKPMSTGRTCIQATTGGSHQDNVSLSSRISAGSAPSQGRSEQTTKRPRNITDSKEKGKSDKSTDFEVDTDDSGIEKTSFLDSVSMAKRPRITTESKKKEKADRSMNSMGDTESSDIGKTDFSNSVSSSFIGDASGETVGAVAETEQCNGSFVGNASGEMVGGAAETAQCNGGSLKETETYGAVAETEQCSGDSSSVNETIALNSMYSDSLEAAVMDLEELANRVKWLKGILQFGMPSNTVQHRWKFVEHRASSTPR